MAAFKGRKLANYYVSGPGKGLSFQNLPSYSLVTTSATIIQEPEEGNHYAPASSLLLGVVSAHDSGLAPLYVDPECPGATSYDFNPLDYESAGGNMVLFNTTKGGLTPWDPNYYANRGSPSRGFDGEYIMRHATDSAPTASSYATGVKVRWIAEL